MRRRTLQGRGCADRTEDDRNVQRDGSAMQDLQKRLENPLLLVVRIIQRFGKRFNLIANTDRVAKTLSNVAIPDSRKTGVSATWMMWAIVSSADPVLSIPNIDRALSGDRRSEQADGTHDYRPEPKEPIAAVDGGPGAMELRISQINGDLFGVWRSPPHHRPPATGLTQGLRASDEPSVQSQGRVPNLRLTSRCLGVVRSLYGIENCFLFVQIFAVELLVEQHYPESL